MPENEILDNMEGVIKTSRVINIPKQELENVSYTKKYDFGYRIVYFYKNYHEILKDLCVKEIGDFIVDKKENLENLIDDVLNKYLKLNKEALAVAIYNVNGSEIARKISDVASGNINDTVKYKEELMYDYGVKNIVDGYRIVYFDNDDNYSIGSYAKDISDFMMDFCLNDPIENESDIPEFISIDDLLNRYLTDLIDVKRVAIYKTNGTLVAEKEREDIK